MSVIEVGFEGLNFNYKKIIDRREAIREAIREAKKNDIVIIAGKGHETYQIFPNRIVDFADLPVFDGALTYVSIFFFEKKSVRRKSIYFYKVPKLPFIVPSSEQFIEISYDSLEEEGWILKSKEVKDCLDKMKSATPDIL